VSLFRTEVVHQRVREFSCLSSGHLSFRDLAYF
jgi:hypothetical protein